MRVIFRADSSTIMGSGHLMRCLTLAKLMRGCGNVDIFFICRDLEGNIASVVSDNDFNLIMLSNAEHNSNLSGYEAWLTVSQEQDADETIDAVGSISSERHVDYVIVDSYAIDEIWEKKLRPYTKKIFVIDDLANRKHDCDFLLDQTYGIENANKYCGLVPSHCVQFLGTSYSLLKLEYRKLRNEIHLLRQGIKYVLVFFGGSDDTGETVKFLEALRRNRFEQYHFIVIIGGGNQKKNIIRTYCDEIDNVEFHCQVDNMEYYISICDLAFASAGVNTWERCVLGLPSFITVTSDNQREIAAKMREQNAAVILGDFEDVNSEDYSKALCRIDKIDIASLSKNAARLMENNGIDELLKVIGVGI